MCEDEEKLEGVANAQMRGCLIRMLKGSDKHQHNLYYMLAV